MPAPKRPNTAAATKAARAAARQRRLEALSSELRTAGWTAYPPSGETQDKRPMPHLDALRAHKALTDDLHQWAPTVHRLVRERITVLLEAYGEFNHPLETAEEHAARVLARCQNPFPPGVSIYENLNDNRGYDHIEIGYGLEGDGDLRITFAGWYPHWAADGESYERRFAEIHCPGWLVTEPDGVDRYRAQTEEMAAEVRQQVAAEHAAISALLNGLHDRSNGGGQPVTQEGKATQ